MTSGALNRRSFLKVSLAATGTLTLSLPWRAGAQDDTELNAFVTLHPDGSATITVPRSEMGQGILTALAMVVAEELDLPMNRVQARQADADAQRYGAQGTGGSASVRTRFLDLRRAGATARVLLRAAAAQRWQVPPETCGTRDGEVEHPPSGRRIAYQDLLADLADLPVPDDPPLKQPEFFRIIGRSHKRLELPELLAGRGGFGVDTRLPGMVFAVVARCPAFGGRLESFDASAARQLEGVLNVIELPAVAGNAGVSGGVAVIASSSWAALRGREALELRWQMPAGEAESDALHSAQLDSLLVAPAEDIVHEHGDAEAALAKAGRVITARYTLPFLAHTTLEPMNCTAQFRDGTVELWSPTQSPGFTVQLVAETLDLEASKVRLHVTRMGGGFGRRLNADFSVEAALLARALNGAPVQLLWSREDDLQHDFYRPCSQHQLRASLDADGEPEAWAHHLASPAIFAALQMPPQSDRPGVYEATGAADMPYRVTNRRCAYSLLPSRVPRGFWRAVSATHTVFAVESFIDELAAAAGRDALEYRISLIDRLPESLPLRDANYPFEPERLKAVLLLAAERAGWNWRRPAGRGLGIACCWDHLSYVAQTIEVSLPNPLQIQVHRVVTAIDCGLVINPDGVRAQVEGSVIQGLSAALRERVQLADGRVQQSNFHDYPILRQAESPFAIEVLLRASADAPTGAGEPALPAVAPALANAIFAASGRRLRNLPLDRQTLSLA